ncbi:MAG: hypothetical protein IJ637_07240 [Prevotella sp.]|nr:hypothetical protein [Prevotella sp.]
MKATEQTIQQIERALRKVADKFPASQEASVLTDIHLCANQETGELVAFDDDDKEITRCVVEQWIDNKDDNFYQDAAATLRSVITRNKAKAESLSILKPYSYVLEDDDREAVAELYLVDDDIVIIDDELMAGLDKDLDDFFDNPMKK